MIGLKFNRLTIIKEGERLGGRLSWLCKCSCGKEKLVRAYHLKVGAVQSCGCYRNEKTSQRFKDNLLHKRFGRLLVLGENGRTSAQKVKWLCRCDCGNEIITTSGDLNSGTTKSCNCYQKDKASEIHAGKIVSLETKKKISIATKERLKDPSKNPNWRGGISPLFRKIRTSIEYKQWRMAVFGRDNYICQNCKKKGGDLNAHHIFPFTDYSRLRLVIRNGITLCKECHQNTYGKEFDFIRLFLSITGSVQGEALGRC